MQTTCADELRRFGPDNQAAPLSLAEAFAYCRRLAESHYENFTVASFLLPKQLRAPFHVVYSYCRWSDDLGDEIGGDEESRRQSLRLLDWWERGLDDCFAGNPPNHPVYVALLKIAGDFRLQKQPFADLLVAFRLDQKKQRYETFDELLEYCRFSADPVGRIVLQLAYGAVAKNGPDAEQLAWSDSICTGLQLANHWQDVARDFKLGRCYIPRSVADRFGVDRENMLENDDFRRMIRFLVDDARNRLLAGTPLIDSAPKLIRTDLKLFQRGGLAVLDAIEKIGYNVLRTRPVVSRWAKLRLVFASFFG